jgi:hypothetical protein
MYYNMLFELERLLSGKYQINNEEIQEAMRICSVY